MMSRLSLFLGCVCLLSFSTPSYADGHSVHPKHSEHHHEHHSEGHGVEDFGHHEKKHVIQESHMTVSHMVKILSDFADEATAVPNSIFLVYEGVELVCVYDERHNRMRIISAIAPLGDITEGQFLKAMEANFHSALDARYAVKDGILYSAFLHPIHSLEEKQLQAALYQVATLAKTFGSSYTSGILNFGGLGQPL